jgi:hypothetical protein
MDGKAAHAQLAHISNVMGGPCGCFAFTIPLSGSPLVHPGSSL